jgi:uncharacterized membrane protein YdjX (TVP38/TMEM64 family)
VAKSRLLWRTLIGVLVVACIAGAVYLWFTQDITPSSVRAWLESLGPGAPVLFVGAFVAGVFFGMPGMVFVVGARLAFGPWLGFVVSYIGGVLAVVTPFAAARLLRRAVSEPHKPKNRYVARAFAEVEVRPFRAVLVIRLIVWFNAPISYGLAITEVRLRDYALACAVALAPVTAAANAASGWFA